MVDAVVKGEDHASRKDKQALLDLDLGRFEAVFLESHKTDFFKQTLTPGFGLFAVGHIIYGATFGRIYQSSDEFREKVESVGIPIYDVDADIHETYEMLPLWKRLLFLLVSPFFGAFILGFILALVAWGLQYPSPVLGSVVSAIVLLFLFGFAWAYAYFHLIEVELLSDRDRYMAEEIQRITGQESFESVLVNCGDFHVPGISSILEEEGWQVEQLLSQSWVSGLFRHPSTILGAIVHPRQTFLRN